MPTPITAHSTHPLSTAAWALRALGFAMLASGVGALIALAQAGRIVGRFGPRGEPSVWPGLIRPEDRQDMQQAAKQIDPEIGLEALASQPGTPPRAVHSERLMRRLTAHRVAATFKPP